MTFDPDNLQYIINKRKEKIEELRETAEKRRKELESGDSELVEKASHVHYVLGNKYPGLVERLFQQNGRDLSDSSEYFADSADAFTDAIEIARQHRPSVANNRRLWSELPYNGWRALYSAILSKKRDQQIRAAEETLAIPVEYVEEFPENASKYYYAQALAATVVEDERAHDYVELTHKALDNNPEYDSVAEPGMFDAVQAVLNTDDAAINDAIQTHVEYFRNQKNDEGLDPDEYLDFRGAAMTILARERGMDVPARDPNVPEIIL